MLNCQSGSYNPVFCDIVNHNKLHCFPTNGEKEFDISTVQALGYRCISPKDWTEGKKRIREAAETMDLDPTGYGEL